VNASWKLAAAMRHKLGQLFLRGKLLKFWLARSTRIMKRAYETLLASYFAHPLVPEKKPQAQAKAPTLESLLFVCCDMWERSELLPELQRLAHTTFVDLRDCYRSTTGCRSRFTEEDWMRVLSELPKGVRYDAAVVYLDSLRLQEPILEWVRSVTAGPVLGMNLDDKTTYANFPVFRRDAQGYRNWAGRFDFNLSSSKTFMDIYRADGYRCLYLPTGYHYNPLRHFAPASTNFSQVISFVGSQKPERLDLIERLRELGLPIKLYGNGWDGAQFADDTASVYRSTQINLGLGFNLPGEYSTNLKNRDFECPGSGGCYLTTFDWELTDFYEIGREILCYRSVADLCEIYLHYSRRPEECRKIAQAGFERARREHTWAHRFASVFRNAGLSLSWNG
jgi:hypothetical protein